MSTDAKVYLGVHAHEVYVRRGQYEQLPLEHRARHSPDGFSWGYGGSGPADLALSILWDHLRREPSIGLYQSFKWDFIAKFGDEWELTSEEIDDWLARLGYPEEITP